MNLSLIDLLNLVNSWLKHAESKNAVLLGFIGVSGSLIFSRLTDINQAHIGIKIWLGFAFLCLIIAAMITILSFLPTLVSLKSGKKNISPKKVLNPYYFGDIAVMDSTELLKRISGEETPKDKELWLADQIVANSRIAIRKYYYFQTAVWVAFFGIVFPIALISFISYLFLKKKK